MTSASEIRQHATEFLSRKHVFDSRVHRQIAGICSTATVDSHGSTLDPKGMTYEPPVPLLFHHQLTLPIGWIHSITAGPAIRFLGRIANDLPWVDEIWEKIKSGEVDCTSIRFDWHQQDYSRLQRLHIARWNLSEISVLPAGANPDAKIHLVREVERPDAVQLRGERRERVYRDVRAQYQELLSEPMQPRMGLFK